MKNVDMTVLLTGGTGFIGSHTAVALLQAGERVVLLDNLINSSAVSLQEPWSSSESYALPGDCLTSDAPTVFFCTKQSASSTCQGSSLPRTPPNTADDRA